MKQEWEKKVKKDNTNGRKANGKYNGGWKIKVRPGKERRREQMTFFSLLVNRTSLKQIAGEKLSFCFLASLGLCGSPEEACHA